MKQLPTYLYIYIYIYVYIDIEPAENIMVILCHPSHPPPHRVTVGHLSMADQPSAPRARASRTAVATRQSARDVGVCGDNHGIFSPLSWDLAIYSPYHKQDRPTEKML